MIQEHISQLASYVESLIIGICHLRIENGRMFPVYINEGCSRTFKCSRTDMTRFLEKFENNVITEDLPVFQQAIVDALKDDGPVETELRIITPAGRLCWLFLRCNMFLRGDNFSEIICLLADITERKSMEEEMANQADRLNLIIQSEKQIILDYNAKTDVMTFRKTGNSGITNDEIVPRYLEDFARGPHHEEDKERLHGIFKELTTYEGCKEFEFRSKRFSNDYHWFQSALSSIADNEGYITRIVGRMVDIHEKKLRELEMERRAERDFLSGLYNKGASKELITNALMDSGNKTVHALMLIDLDNFKKVNDLFGHAEGDRLIEDVSARIRNTFKGADIIGRTGGDEFIVLVKDIEAVSNADILAEKLLKNLRKVYLTGDGAVEVTGSIGVSIYPYHGLTYQELFDKADKSMYFTKEKGKNNYSIYNVAATKAVHARGYTMMKSENCGDFARDVDMEELILDVLHEERERGTAMGIALELIADRFGFHRAYMKERVGADRDYSLYYSGEGSDFRNEKRDTRIQNLMLDSMTQADSRLIQCNLEEPTLTPDQKRYFFRNNIKSMVFYPFSFQGTYEGGIVFEKIDETFQCTDQDKRLLLSLMRIVDSYMISSSHLYRMPHILTLLKFVENMDSYAYVVDGETGILNFVNKKVMEAFPGIRIGDSFHNLFGEEGASFIGQLDKRNARSQFSRVMHHGGLGEKCYWNCSWLDCTRDNQLALVTAISMKEWI